jgi:hypothetical protein
MELFFSANKSRKIFLRRLKTKHPARLVSAERDASDLGCALD